MAGAGIRQGALRLPAASASATPGGISLAALPTGMTANEVRGVLEQPDQIKPFKSPDTGVTIWIYQRTVEGPVRDMVTGTREVPSVNPFTAQTQAIQEPIHGRGCTYFHETIERLMRGDPVVEWKPQIRDEREFR